MGEQVAKERGKPGADSNDPLNDGGDTPWNFRLICNCSPNPLGFIALLGAMTLYALLYRIPAE